MRVVLILGIDPGPKLHGYALLDVTRERRRYVSSGHCDTAEMVARIGCAKADGVEAVGVEWSTEVLGFGSPARALAIARALLGAQSEASALATHAEVLLLRVERISALEWRRGIVGKKSPTNKMVRAAILRLVEGWPARSSAGAHACDAAGVALAAFNKARGSRREEVA